MKCFVGEILGDIDVFGYFVLQIAPIMERFRRVSKLSGKSQKSALYLL